LLPIVAAAILFSVGAAAAARPRQGAEILLDTYVRNSAKLQKNNFGIPLFMESYEKDDKVHVDVYWIFDHPFSSVVNVLKVPANSVRNIQAPDRPIIFGSYVKHDGFC